MSEILPGVHLIDPPTGDPSFTTHLYLLKDPGGEYTLVDTGLPGAESSLRGYLAEQRIEPRSIRRILITHLHRDHVGGLKATVALTGARIYAHWIEAAFLRQKPKYDGPGTPPAEAVEVQERLKDGDRIEAFGGLVAYHTPGHTPGHTAYYQPERQILFAGDLFFGEGESLELTPPAYTLHTGTAQISASRVSGLPIESILNYHGGPFPRGAKTKLDRLVRGFG